MLDPIPMAGVILEDEEGRIALQLRDNNSKIINPGKWSVFGGHIEADEDPAAAALREMHEELSISLDLEKLTLLGKFPYKDRFFYVFHYLVSGEMEHVELKEGRSWRWCAPDEIKGGMIEGSEVVDYHIAFLEQYWAGKV
jgi:8-oxo-dGTP pyrophosphatase MutT (NUDIX family)